MVEITAKIGCKNTLLHDSLVITLRSLAILSCAGAMLRSPVDSSKFKLLDFKDLDFKDLDFKDLDFKDLDFKDLDFKDLDFKDLDFKDLDFKL